MLHDLIVKGVLARVCGTCMARCGIHENEPHFVDAEKSTMAAPAEWTADGDKTLTCSVPYRIFQVELRHEGVGPFIPILFQWHPNR
jgi:hypothetical protein